MTDDLIARLRALMAEIEARLADDDGISPKLRQAVTQARQEARDALAVGADVGAEPKPHDDSQTQSMTYRPSKADDRSATRARQIKLDDYIPRSPSHAEGFDASDFLGTGDTDPLGHDAAIRR
jgi:hypothetical protein